MMVAGDLPVECAASSFCCPLALKTDEPLVELVDTIIPPAIRLTLLGLNKTVRESRFELDLPVDRTNFC